MDFSGLFLANVAYLGESFCEGQPAFSLSPSPFSLLPFAMPYVNCAIFAFYVCQFKMQFELRQPVGNWEGVGVGGYESVYPWWLQSVCVLMRGRG